MSDPWILVSQREVPLVTGVRDLQGLTMSLVDNIYIQGRLEADYPDIRIHPADDHLRALEAVSTGRADAYIGPLSVAGYFILHNRLTHLKIAAPSGYPPAEVKFGVRKDWPELVGILDRAISTVSRQEVDAIFRKWVPVHYHHRVDWTHVWKWIAGIVIAFALLLGVSLWWNRKLTAEIHERKRAEEELEKSQTILKKTEELSDIGGYECDIPSGRLVFSDGWMKIHGCEKRSLSVEELMPIALPEDVPKIENAFDEALRNVQPYRLEHRVVRQNDGVVRVIQASAEVIFDDRARPVKMYGSVQDITEWKKAEQALKESQNKLQAILNSTEQSFVLVDRNAVILAFNHVADRFAKAVFGRSIRVGRSLLDFVHPSDLASFDRHFRMALGGEIAMVEKEMPGGQWFSFSYNPVYDENKTITGVCFNSRNITVRKKAEAQLMDYSERLEEMVAARTRELEKAQEELILKERLAVLGNLSGSISHELRNPLAAIDSSVYLLKIRLGQDVEKVGDHLQRISSNIRQANGIIQSLLDLTRMETPRTRPFDLRRLVSEVLRGDGIPNTVRIDTSFPEEDLPAAVDVQQIRMALKNIVQNAIQAMDGDGTLRVALRSAEPDRAVIRVSDSGPGIPPDLIEKIFQPLFSTKVHGIGFGLSITKMIIEKHGGDLTAESAPGGGAAFTIALPRARKEDLQ